MRMWKGEEEENFVQLKCQTRESLKRYHNTLYGFFCNVRHRSLCFFLSCRRQSQLLHVYNKTATTKTISLSTYFQYSLSY